MQPPTVSQPSESGDPIRQIVGQHWGYHSLRPLQHEAMSAARDGIDSLVVLPTGGGKSLCYQAPALLNDKPTVVVSPLIALMKDQVDALIERGIGAAFLNSSLTPEDRRRVSDGIQGGEYKLIFVAPERFASGNFWQLLQSSGVGAFAIDEAHCISHWGHDFRSDYRRLDQLSARFPKASIHAFTATATPRVRQDIIGQLHLREPKVLVGDFFRPNLHYRIVRRESGFLQLTKLVKEREGQAGIVYCIRRRDVDEISQHLSAAGVKADGYHAGLSDAQRTRVQDRFSSFKTDVIVATVAFGMGIDRSDIRFVIHAAMPKSIEHYQQETGRAGRDGKPADCILLYGGADLMTWKRIMELRGGADMNIAMPLLNTMDRFCTGIRCRHESLVTYFGQPWTNGNCGACDMCLDGVNIHPDSTTIAQKIMSAVVKTGQRFGAAYVCDTLIGACTEKVLERGHDRLSTFGILEDEDKRSVTAWIDQLVDQEMLFRDGEFRVLKVTDLGWQVLHMKAEARLLPPQKTKRAKKKRTPKTDGNPRPTTRSKSQPLDQSSYEDARVKLYESLGRNLNCPDCSYSMFGSRRAICPECGYRIDLDTLGVSVDDFRRVAAKGAGIKLESAPPLEEQIAPSDADDHVDTSDESDSHSEALFEKLRQVRLNIAREISKPAFFVFSDRTLRAIAQAAPRDADEMLKVKGVGPAKLEAYGQQFLEAIEGVIHE
jgi:ATP-dependent DNA helicase RecQ